MKILNRLLPFVSSLKLTVICLVFALIVTFAGTIAQVKLGLWQAQEEYFRSMFVWWGPEGAGWKIPVLPGGWLLGGVLLINLLAAHAKRFKFTRQKTGIFLIHFGLILLLVGQIITEVTQVESVMHFVEGQSKNYSESQRESELVFIDKSDPARDKVVAIPESLLAEGKVIEHPELPFSVKLQRFARNSEPTRGRASDAASMTAQQGIGQLVQIAPKPVTAKMDDRNIPGAALELLAEGKSLGTWLVSPWASDPMLASVVTRQFGGGFASLHQPQQLTHNGKTWQIALRFTRHYKDHSITLLQADHDIYVGTDIPKNFSSLVRIDKAGEPPREVRIYMNNPLRYGGETYYQYQMGPDERGRPGGNSTLQVVRNPVWLTPYISCTLVGAGMLVQFLMHLFNFAKRSKTQSGPPSQGASGKGARSQKAAKAGRAAQQEPAMAAGKLKTQA